MCGCSLINLFLYRFYNVTLVKFNAAVYLYVLFYEINQRRVVFYER